MFAVLRLPGIEPVESSRCACFINVELILHISWFVSSINDYSFAVLCAIFSSIIMWSVFPIIYYLRTYGPPLSTPTFSFFFFFFLSRPWFWIYLFWGIKSLEDINLLCFLTNTHTFSVSILFFSHALYYYSTYIQNVKW